MYTHKHTYTYTAIDGSDLSTTAAFHFFKLALSPMRIYICIKLENSQFDTTKNIMSTHKHRRPNRTLGQAHICKQFRSYKFSIRIFKQTTTQTFDKCRREDDAFETQQAAARWPREMNLTYIIRKTCQTKYAIMVYGQALDSDLACTFYALCFFFCTY